MEGQQISNTPTPAEPDPLGSGLRELQSVRLQADAPTQLQEPLFDLGIESLLSFALGTIRLVRARISLSAPIHCGGDGVAPEALIVDGRVKSQVAASETLRSVIRRARIVEPAATVTLVVPLAGRIDGIYWRRSISALVRRERVEIRLVAACPIRSAPVSVHFVPTKGIYAVKRIVLGIAICVDPSP
jgi:hypothetical protein